MYFRVQKWNTFFLPAHWSDTWWGPEDAVRPPLAIDVKHTLADAKIGVKRARSKHPTCRFIITKFEEPHDVIVPSADIS